MAALNVNIAGVDFKNPIIAASASGGSTQSSIPFRSWGA